MMFNVTERAREAGDGHNLEPQLCILSSWLIHHLGIGEMNEIEEMLDSVVLP
jgi:hypothetical protein